jgi:N-glycosylase/DNA lyase
VAAAPAERLLRAQPYALDATLGSGQAFGWQFHEGGWSGVVGHRWVELRQTPAGILAKAAAPTADWSWLIDYLQTAFDLPAALQSFPPDPILTAAVRSYHGLHLLRQDPWVCLASFLLSATKQILQIQQIHQELCRRFGQTVAALPGRPNAFCFPDPATLAGAGEAALRECRMGFRARYLHNAARHIAEGFLDLTSLRGLPLAKARQQLLALPGVGRKIADCVLLFACDQPRAFPVDVWIARTLRSHYFEGRPVSLPTLQRFAEEHFGPHAGLAQQYLFHYARRPPTTPGSLLPTEDT